MQTQETRVIDSIQFECFYLLPQTAYECVLMSQYDTTITVNHHTYTTHNRDTDFSNMCELAKWIQTMDIHDEINANDEYWVLTIGYTNESMVIKGKITREKTPFNVEVSRQIRELTGDAYLWLLDDDIRLNRMMAFGLTIIRDDDPLYGSTTLSLDITREQQTLVYSEHKGDRLVREFSLHDVMIEQMLNNMGEFSLQIDQRDYVQPLKLTEMKITYSLNVQFDGERPLSYRGNFRRFELPIGFDAVISVVSNYMQWLVHTRPLDKYFMDLKNDELIYYEVEFESGGKTYYYTYDDFSLVGQMVMVPTGDDQHLEIAKAVQAEVFEKDKVPYPLDKIKKIVGLANLS